MSEGEYADGSVGLCEEQHLEGGMVDEGEDHGGDEEDGYDDVAFHCFGVLVVDGSFPQGGSVVYSTYRRRRLHAMPLSDRTEFRHPAHSGLVLVIVLAAELVVLNANEVEAAACLVGVGDADEGAHVLPVVAGEALGLGDELAVEGGHGPRRGLRRSRGKGDCECLHD